MVKAICHLENSVFQFKLIKRILDVPFKDVKIRNKNSVSVMDVGCGSGTTLLEHLLPKLPKNFYEVIGVDKYDSMIEYCRKLEVDPRVSFHKLDIQTRDIPKKFEYRFDLITSFLCLHYATDYDKALQNIHRMLKPDGELFFMQAIALNPLYETYRELGKIRSWKSYFRDFENFSNLFTGNNKSKVVEKIFRRNAFKLMNFEFLLENFEIKPENFIEMFKALDNLGNDVPDNQKKEYLKDFHECFSRVMNFDFVNKKSLETKTNLTFEFLTVHAEKL